jgi:hypothetical protein
MADPVSAPLAGTAERVRRSGHARVVVGVHAGHPPDEEGELIVLWEEEEYVW